MLKDEDIWRLILPLQSPECVGRWFPPEDDISVVETWFNRVQHSLVTSDAADAAQKEVCRSLFYSDREEKKSKLSMHENIDLYVYSNDFNDCY